MKTTGAFSNFKAKSFHTHLAWTARHQCLLLATNLLRKGSPASLKPGGPAGLVGSAELIGLPQQFTNNGSISTDFSI
jgi:hypothetical protein